jgi:crossover junction endodeoxyribonuclease RusA
MTDRIVIPLPWEKPPLTGNRTRGNPYARAQEVKAAKAAAEQAIRESLWWAVVGAEVALHFRPKDKRRRDADGLAPTLKVCLDALVAQGVIPEDSWVHVPAATCRIHPPNGEPAAMWLELTNLHHYDQEQPRDLRA